MKEFTAVLAVFVLTIFSQCLSPNQNAERQICDSTVSLNGKVKRVDYFDSQKRIVKYDAFFQDTTTEKWILSAVNEIYYTKSGKIAKERLSVPNQYLEIRPLELDSFVYDEKDLKTESVHLVSGGISDKWTKVSRHVFKYLKNDTSVFSESIFYWDIEQQKWIVRKENYYEYDTFGRVSSLLTYERDKYDTSKVQKNFQEFFYPDDDGMNPYLY
ncbi:MAG: hypothetical protein II956_02105 [Bacteroidales bacterium]|nr:hypothetical protein [Bacteroidales bacterium]